MSQKPLKISVISKIPNVAREIVKRLPRLSSHQITERGPNILDEALSAKRDGADLDALAEKLVGDSDIVVADLNILGPVVYHPNLKNVKWVQSTWAGVDFLFDHIDHDKAYPDFKLVRFAGKFGQHMSEYVLGHIIAHERNFKGTYKSQEKSFWNEEIKFHHNRLLNSLSISILGVGEIGKHVAKICKGFGMTVYGLVSKEVPDEEKLSCIDKYYSSREDLPEILQQSDYVCSILPKTPQTNRILSNGILENCKDRKTILINIGRGNIILESEIISALESGWIGGAILDVFNEEPLPKANKLWSFPNVVITPHCSGLSMAHDVAEVFVKNLQIFENGEELKNTVDWEKGY